MPLPSQPPPPSPDVLTSWHWSRDELAAWQLAQFNAELARILPDNRFYRAKLGDAQAGLTHLDQLSQLPLTTKQELVASAAADPDGISTHHTYPPSSYSRMHRTSGTSGKPLLILDTAMDWQWWSSTWQHVLQSAEVTANSRVFLAFSFGPFIGFWSAHQACVDRGAAVIPGGGLSSLARLEFMRQTCADIVCCTPSYALHLVEVAQQENWPLEQLEVERLIVAGEAGGSIPAVREQLEQAWQAQVIDHAGATEIGPWGFGWPDRPGLHVTETSFIAELLPLETSSGNPLGDAQGVTPLCELVLTSLGRYGAPLIRYRTGDVVHAGTVSASCNFLWLPQGVVGRVDDMVTIRGVNVFPSSIDEIVRQVSGIHEYRVTVDRDGALDRLQVEIESDSDQQPPQLEKLLSTQLGLRIAVRIVPHASLPRSELKARRWIDTRFREP
ncbi:MAG: phenylacetate--CoA ligase family protein [Pirellulaceae bacterium]